jgi:hypothetical protein
VLNTADDEETGCATVEAEEKSNNLHLLFPPFFLFKATEGLDMAEDEVDESNSVFSGRERE